MKSLHQPASHGRALAAAFDRGHRPGRPVNGELATIYRCWSCNGTLTVDPEGAARGLDEGCPVIAERPWPGEKNGIPERPYGRFA